MNFKQVMICFLPLMITFGSCREAIIPKPKGYFRIDLPQKEYRVFNDPVTNKSIPLKFEYPVYGTITSDAGDKSEAGWFNVDFPGYKAKLYLTYKGVERDLESLIEQTYTMNVKNHISKADAIDEMVISDSINRIYGILYDLKGNTASAVQFYVTDSTDHFLRGSLYFEAEPNADSLAPVTAFFREDVIHMIETLKWIK